MKLELRGSEGAKANYSTWSIYWWNQKNLDGLSSICKNVFKSLTFRTKMSLCHLNSYIWWFVIGKDIPNVHFLLHVAERRPILGHSEVWKAPRNQGILGNLGGSPRTPGKILELQSSENF